MAIWIIIGILLVGCFLIIILYNRLIQARNLNKEAFSNVDVALKQRYDLIPNLETVVKGYAQYEKNILKDVTKLRNIKATEQIEDRAKMESNFTNDLKSLFAVIENYPDLKASQAFLEFQNNLVKVEETIECARRYYNGTTRNYNILIQKFPSNLLASMMKWEEKPFFEIDLATKVNPKVTN